jgi:hypothetical protein
MKLVDMFDRSLALDSSGIPGSSSSNPAGIRWAAK